MHTIHVDKHACLTKNITARMYINTHTYTHKHAHAHRGANPLNYLPGTFLASGSVKTKLTVFHLLVPNKMLPLSPPSPSLRVHAHTHTHTANHTHTNTCPVITPLHGSTKQGHNDWTLAASTDWPQLLQSIHSWCIAHIPSTGQLLGRKKKHQMVSLSSDCSLQMLCSVQ